MGHKMNKTISSTWHSPAKINLFLHINGRREDGYHELQSLFAILDFGDSITFTPNNDNQVYVSVAPKVNFDAKENIVYKAAMQLREKANITEGINIHIEKRIPIGGGLGGGSSNAATTLIALNKIWQTNLSVDTLAEMGKKLGADVPIFVRGRSAFAEGIGEKITPYEIEEKYYLVVTPKDTHISTKEIFCDPNLTRNTPKFEISTFSIENTQNDCENLVKKNYPSVANCLSWLLKYGSARMTGTGASCFVSFNTLEDAQKAQKELPACYNSFVAKAKNYSPIFESLEAYNHV